ncbi:hypothetical protein DL93DRAFT_2053507 [Clavulina sp. PMI_390]|nr:hypothetical protein DL93DRAFT_2053507 [Clavulina sp. PMI_390]
MKAVALGIAYLLSTVVGRIFATDEEVTSPVLSAERVPPPSLEVHPLHVSGPPSNRVNLVFFSDGYTHAEHEKFLQDAHRLAKDLTANQTFAPVLPLLNFFAAYSPSVESGIGVGGKQKNTVFGLYRDGTELRAVWVGKRAVAKAACDSLGRRCDYPILLGNDPLYGGLGGEFSITTSSILNGPLVLRHELGHSIIDVGEEYDGGYAYFGANSSPNTTLSHIKWAHWLTNSSTSSNEPSQSKSEQAAPLIPQRATMLHQSYPWTLLNHSTSPYTIYFNSSGAYDSALVRTSLSGLPDSSHLTILLDGADLKWAPKEGLGLDRWHYDIKVQSGKLAEGKHTLEFVLGKDAKVGLAQLCSAEVLEYGSAPDEFDDRPGVISLFPTFSDTFRPELASDDFPPAAPISYRPTNEACLMRLVTFPNFCSPCLESLWLHLLEHVDLIEHLAIEVVDVDGEGAEVGNSVKKKRVEVALRLLPFGADRALLMAYSESYEITWKKHGVVLGQYTNLTSISFDIERSLVDVEVRLRTADVRLDPEGLLTSRRTF